jgi:hypothetical protein
MHLLVSASKGLNELQEKYNGFHRERDEIFSALNEKVITKRNQTYKACQQEVLAELNLEEDDIANNDGKKEEIENLVMERLDKEYIHAFRQEGLYAGTPIYKKRNEWIVFLLIGLALYDLSMAFLNCSFPVILLTCGIMLLVADMQTGILHITLDNRLSFNFPVLSQPSMEFQWHHIIPHDLADRYCVDVWGDLNVIMIIEAVILTGFKTYLKDPLYYPLGSFQILFIYLAIYCHRLAHSSSKYNDFLTKLMHRHHKIHHIAPHNENYCLIGLGDFIIAPMTKYIPPLLGESISYIFFLLCMLGLMMIHPAIVKCLHFFF